MSIIFGIIIALLAVLFSFQNIEPVSLNFFFLNFESSLSLVILISLIVGFFVAVLLIGPLILKTNLLLGDMKKEIHKLKEKDNDVGIVYESDGLGESGEYKSGRKSS